MEYYIQFSDETLSQVVSNHSSLYKTIESAIEHANIEAEGSIKVFFVLDKSFEIVHKGITSTRTSDNQ